MADENLATAPVTQEIPQQSGVAPLSREQAIQAAEQGLIAPETRDRILASIPEPKKQAIGAAKKLGGAAFRSLVPETAAEGALTTDVEPTAQLAEAAPAIDFSDTKASFAEAEETGRNAAIAEVGFREELATGLEESQTRQIARSQERQKEVEAELGKLDEKLDELSRQTPDTNRFFSNLSTGNKILAGISLFLGAAAGAQNPAANIIGRAIENDINEQRKNLRSSFESLQKRKSLLSEMSDIFKNPQQAEQAARITMINATNQRVQALAAQTKNANAQVKLAQASSQLEQLEQASRAKFMEASALSALQGGADGRLEAISRLPEKMRERIVIFPGNQPRVAKNRESAKKLSKAITLGQEVKDQLTVIKNLFKKFGTRNILDRGAIATEESARRSMQLQLKELFNLGVLNGPDLDLLNEFTGEDFFSLTTLDETKFAKLAGVDKFLTSKIKAAALEAGVKPTEIKSLKKVEKK